MPEPAWWRRNRSAANASIGSYPDRAWQAARVGWGWQGDAELPPEASTVTVTIEPAAGGTLVTLVHEGLTDEQEAQHASGWNHYFERLEKLASTGTAGQDEWAWAPANLDPVVAAEAVLAVIQPMLRNLTPADQPKPTPCTQFSCHQLTEHLFDSLEQLGGMAGVAVVNPEQGSLENRISVMTAQGSRQELHVSDQVVTYLKELAEVVVPSGRPGGCRWLSEPPWRPASCGCAYGGNSAVIRVKQATNGFP